MRKLAVTFCISNGRENTMQSATTHTIYRWHSLAELTQN